jgi:hypothetical protein
MADDDDQDWENDPLADAEESLSTALRNLPMREATNELLKSTASELDLLLRRDGETWGSLEWPVRGMLERLRDHTRRVLSTLRLVEGVKFREELRTLHLNMLLALRVAGETTPEDPEEHTALEEKCLTSLRAACNLADNRDAPTEWFTPQ